MLRVRTEYGVEIEASDATDLVRQLKLEQLAPSGGREAYKAEVAKRCELYNNQIICYEDDGSFIWELHRIGAIEILKGSP